MKFVSFSDTSNDKNYTYSYTKRGTKEPYYPDNKCERIDGIEMYDKTSGNLFYDIEVSWYGEVLLDQSVDINVNLREMHFVDHIYIKQSDDSKPGSVDILTKEENHLKKIATYSVGTHITQEEITIPVGYYCDNVIVRLNGAYENIGIKKLDICSAVDIENSIFPISNSVTYTDGLLPLDKVTGVSCDCSCGQFAASYLCERLNEKFNLEVSPTKAPASVELNFSERADEGFEIQVSQTGCKIYAGCNRGFIYAADALIQLGTDNGIRCCTVSDKPE